MKKLLSAISFVALGTMSAMANASTISKSEVLDAQQAWADGIVAISKVYLDEGDYTARAKQHIQDLYAYGMGDVLFKPTLMIYLRTRRAPHHEVVIG